MCDYKLIAEFHKVIWSGYGKSQLYSDKVANKQTILTVLKYPNTQISSRVMYNVRSLTTQRSQFHISCSARPIFPPCLPPKGGGKKMKKHYSWSDCIFLICFGKAVRG